MKREKLAEVRESYKEIRELKGKIIECETMRTSPRSAVYGTERVQTSLKGDVQAENIDKINELLDLYNQRLKERTELIFEFEKALEKLNAKQRRMMRLYYIDCKTWEQVCVEMNISWTGLHRIRRAAVDKIAND